MIDLFLDHGFIAFDLGLQLCHFLTLGEDLSHLLFDFILCFGSLGFVLINQGLRPFTTSSRFLANVGWHGDFVLGYHILQGLNLHYQLVPFILDIVRMCSLRCARLLDRLKLLSKLLVLILLPCELKLEVAQLRIAYVSIASTAHSCL